jgi:DNA-directed RNA polymerase specialized sigma24 family protein
MSADEIKRSMFNIAGRAVLQTYQEHQCREAIRTGVDTPTKKLVRIEKLDERYAASLTPLRRSIYDMTCSGLSISQIADALQRSKNLVVVERHNIRRMYVVWLRRVYPFQTTWLNRLPKLAHMNDVVRARYVDGAAIPDIAKKTGITANHVRVLLYFARKYLKQKRITVLP